MGQTRCWLGGSHQQRLRGMSLAGGSSEIPPALSPASHFWAILQQRQARNPVQIPWRQRAPTTPQWHHP